MRKRDIAHLRLRNQGLTEPRFAEPEEVVRWLGAVQAQEYAFGKWSVGQRAPGLTEQTVTDAIAEGRMIRTHALRPTWHFLASDDARWILRLTSPRVIASQTYYDRFLELDAATLARAYDAIGEALAGGKRMIRKQLQAVLTEAGIVGTGQRIGRVLMHAELDAVICSGGMIGKQHAYALFDDVIPDEAALTGDEALAELTRRYFRSHGPATLQDYRWWSSLPIAEIKRGIAMCSPEIESFDVEGATYWYAGSLDVTTAPSPSVYLLQAYDEYFVGHTGDRSVVDEAGLAGAILNRVSFAHTLVIDTQVVGRWRRVPGTTSITVEVQLLRALSIAEMDGLEAEVARYGAFVGVPAGLRIVE